MGASSSPTPIGPPMTTSPAMASTGGSGSPASSRVTRTSTPRSRARRRSIRGPRSRCAGARTTGAGPGPNRRSWPSGGGDDLEGLGQRPVGQSRRLGPCPSSTIAAFLELLSVAHLAHVRPQGGELGVEEGGDIDGAVGSLAGHDPHLGHDVWLEPLVEELGEGERDCGRRDRRRKGPPRRLPGGRGGWRRCASQFRSGDWATTRSGRKRRMTAGNGACGAPGSASRRPSGNPRKCTSVTPDRGCRLALLVAAQCGHGRPRHRAVGPAGVTVGRDAVGDIDAAVVQTATEPAVPKSTSSGWAVTTRMRSTPSMPSSTFMTPCSTSVTNSTRAKDSTDHGRTQGTPPSVEADQSRIPAASRRGRRAGGRSRTSRRSAP